MSRSDRIREAALEGARAGLNGVAGRSLPPSSDWPWRTVRPVMVTSPALVIETAPVPTLRRIVSGIFRPVTPIGMQQVRLS